MAKDTTSDTQEQTDVNGVIAANLRRLRKERSLSVGQLSETSGLSKAVISHIERGEGNPTINTIWKIAAALHVPYSSLLEPETRPTTFVPYESLEAQADEGGHYRISCYYPSTAERDFEWFLLEFDPHTRHVTESHLERSDEYLIVKTGELVVEVADDRYVLHEGDSLGFDAKLRHCYENETDEVVQVLCINHYPKG